MLLFKAAVQFSFSLKHGRNQRRSLPKFSIGIDFLGPDPTSSKNKAEKNLQVGHFANLNLNLNKNVVCF